jgi:type IV pilus assembly protein PilW
MPDTHTMLSYTPRMRSSHSGLTLIELMVALAIGMFLMIGAITVFMQGRATFRVTESLSRLQETARFALDVMEPDIRMAGHYGLTNVGANINGRAPAVGTPTTCGNTWVNDFERPVTGTDGSTAALWGCAGLAPVETNADTLLIRRVSEDPALVRSANTVYIQSNRSGTDKSQLFIGTTLPTSPEPTTSQPFRVVANGYYVSRTSALTVTGIGAITVPSLRVKQLIEGGTIVDRELVPGVEDMQVQFGLDTSLPEAATGRGTIDRFVNANDALLTDAGGFRTNERLILAVRVWLRVRAERTERGWTDTGTYTYAGQTFGPFNDGFRRFVISKTIYLRNGNLR